MKKFRKIVTATLLTAVMVVMLIAMASCGAKSALGSFVSAVKKGNLEKAKDYVSGSVSFTYEYDKDNEIAAYIYKKTIGSFSYKVTDSEEKTDDAGEVEATILTVSYSAYSYTELLGIIGVTSAFTDVTKTEVNAALENMQKKEGKISVTCVKDDGDWKLNTVTASFLAKLMGTPVAG